MRFHSAFRKALRMMAMLLLLVMQAGAQHTNEARNKTSPLKIVPPARGIYLGAYDWRESNRLPGVKEFEDAIGTKVALTSGGVSVTGEDQPFRVDAANLKRLHEKGYVVMIDVAIRGHSPQQIIEGRADDLLRNVASSIKLANVPVMLAYPREPELQPQIGFDGGGYGPKGDKLRTEVDDAFGDYGQTDKNEPMSLDGPERYRDMCRHIHDVIEAGAPGIATWVAGAAVLFWPGQTTDDHYKLFYPGDAYVDWHAINIYPAAAGQTDDPQPMKEWATVVDKMWTEITATNPNKPVIIAEFGVHSQGGPRDAWFRDFFVQTRTNNKYKNLGAFIYWQMGRDAFDGSNCRIRTTDKEAATWRSEISRHRDFWLSDIKPADGTSVRGPGGGL